MNFLVAPGGGHAHLDLGLTIGPLVLRVALFAIVPVVACFAVLRGFLAEPGRRTTIAVVVAAGAGVLLELLLSGGLNLPSQTVPLLLAALAAPLYLTLSRDERFVRAVRRARLLAPWVFWPVALLAATQLGAGWFVAGTARTATLLHTGVVLGLVALAWFAVARPKGAIGLRVGAGLLAVGLLGSLAQAVVLGRADSTAGMATSVRVTVMPTRVPAP